MLKNKSQRRFLISLLAIIAMLVTTMPLTVKAATSTLPEAKNGVITLEEDVTLTAKYVVPEGTTLKIDLNGHTLTGPSDNYTIDNSGNLTIVNSKEEGKIVGIAPSSSCIRNLGTLNVDGVTIESAFVAIKNDAEEDLYGNLTVTSSNLTSTYAKTDTGTIMNWGKATVTNSTVTATSSGVAIYASSGADAGKNSEIDITNTKLSGGYAIYSTRADEKNDTTTQTINITGGIISGNMQGASTGGSTNWNFGGSIEYQSNNNYVNSIIMPNAKEGTKITITSSKFTYPLNIPDGVTVTTSESTELTINSNGVSARNLIIKGTVVNMNVLSSYDNAYYPTIERAIYKVPLGEVDAFPNYTNYTMKVLNDTNETKAISVNRRNITIDSNGNTISFTKGLDVNTRGNVILKDSSEKENGKIEGTITNKGILTIESGNYVTAPVTAEGAVTTLNGGTYPIEKIEEANIPDDREIVQNEDGTYSIVYKSADYSKVDELIQKVESLNKEDYKDFSAVEAAVNAVVRDKNITQQAEVDSYAEAIQKAMNALELKQEDTGDKIDNENNSGDEEITPPATGDYIINYAIIFILAIVTLTGARVYNKKNRFNK